LDSKVQAPVRAPAWLRSNQGVAACISVALVALLGYLAGSDWVYRELRDGFRLGFFTVVSVLAMLLCALVMLVDRHRHVVEPEVADSRWSDWAIAVGAMAACELYFELAWRIDFLLVTPLFVAGASYALGVRPLRSALLAGVVTSGVIYGVFRLIGIRLPTETLGL